MSAFDHAQKRVLVLTEDTVLYESLARALVKANLLTASCQDLQQITHIAESFLPDLLLIAASTSFVADPSMCARLRRNHAIAHRPILFFAAGDPRSPIRTTSEALSLGGDYFFPEPLDRDYLAQRVARWLQTPDAPRTVEEQQIESVIELGEQHVVLDDEDESNAEILLIPEAVEDPSGIDAPVNEDPNASGWDQAFAVELARQSDELELSAISQTNASHAEDLALALGSPVEPKELSAVSRLAVKSDAVATAQMAPPLFTGSVYSLRDVLGLLGQIYQEQRTGLLALSHSLAVLICKGQCVATEGLADAQDFVLSLRSFRSFPAELLDNALQHGGEPPAPKDVCAALFNAKMITQTEHDILLQRHLEVALVRMLRHRGNYTFFPRSIDEINKARLPNLESPHAQLVDAVLRSGDREHFYQALGDRPSQLRPCYTAHVAAQNRDERLLLALDGSRNLEQAQKLCLMSPDRAAAVLLVYSHLGLPWQLEQPHTQTSFANGSRWLQPTTLPHAELLQLDAESRLAQLTELVRNSDYFEILGVDANASVLVIDEAYAHMKRMLPIAEITDSPQLLHLAQEIEQSLREARTVLADEHLRRNYLLQQSEKADDTSHVQKPDFFAES